MRDGRRCLAVELDSLVLVAEPLVGLANHALDDRLPDRGLAQNTELTQTALAGAAGVSRATLDALENGRTRELGFSKINKLLAALGFAIKV